MANDTWGTPEPLFQALDRVYQFDLDVCADKDNRKCHRYVGVEKNGLVQPWAPYTCWCNPPYSKPLPWVEKAVMEAANGARVVMLLPVDTSTKWFKRCFASASEIIFLQPRVRFQGAPGSPRWANMVVVWDPFLAGKMANVRVSMWMWKEAVEQEGGEEDGNDGDGGEEGGSGDS